MCVCDAYALHPHTPKGLSALVRAIVGFVGMSATFPVSPVVLIALEEIRCGSWVFAVGRDVATQESPLSFKKKNEVPVCLPRYETGVVWNQIMVQVV